MFATVLTYKQFLRYDWVTQSAFEAKQQRCNSDPNWHSYEFFPSLTCIHYVCERYEQFLEGLTSTGTFTCAISLWFPVLQNTWNKNKPTHTHNVDFVEWLAGAAGNKNIFLEDFKTYYLAKYSVKYLIWKVFVTPSFHPSILQAALSISGAAVSVGGPQARLPLATTSRGIPHYSPDQQGHVIPPGSPGPALEPSSRMHRAASSHSSHLHTDLHLFWWLQKPQL